MLARRRGSAKNGGAEGGGGEEGGTKRFCCLRVVRLAGRSNPLKMVKKKQTRNKVRERRVLVSSGRAAGRKDEADLSDYTAATALAAEEERERLEQGSAVKQRKHKKKEEVPLQSFLSEELQGKAGDDANALVLPAHKPKEDARAKLERVIQEREQKAKLTSKQKKRLQVLLERKRKKERRTSLLASLAEHQLTAEQMQVMKASAEIGQKQSNKQKAKLSLKKERLGVVDEAGAHLVEVNTEDAAMEMPAEFYSYQKSAIMAEGEDEEATPVVGLEGPAVKKKRKRKKRKRAVDPDVQTDSNWTKGEGRTFFVADDGHEEVQELRRKKRRMDEEDPEGPEEKPRDDPMSEDEDEEEDFSDGEAPVRLSSVVEEECKESDAMEVDSEEPSKGAEESAKPKKEFVVLHRSDAIQEQREQLPIYMEEQRIMEAVMENDVVIVCGETGSGKTTQIPQFLFEAGFGSESVEERAGMIAVTQPRRVAAISVAKRIAEEMGVKCGEEVGFQVRYEKSIGPKTKVKLMTDGILLKEMQNDFLLSKYSAIVLDEAHERNINTDILIGLLSRIVPLRAKLAAEAVAELDESVKGLVPKQRRVRPLKLMIMSATLRVNDFVKNPVLFSTPPPVVHIKARQFPVTIHFNRVTPTDGYLEEAFAKTCKIHTRLPGGGILIFMTGQQEIEHLCRKLRQEFPPNFSKTADAGADAKQEGMYVLPLYSMLPTAKQMRVFDPVPAGNRLVVVATNVAETSITIPGIRYVVDTGKAKEKVYEGDVGMSKFQVGWTSKASANQRAGRAGRTQPGHCYRLFSSNVYQNYFDDFEAPEITRTPVEGVVLLMKSMGIDKVESFPFPSPPDRAALRAALSSLYHLGALGADDTAGSSTEPTATSSDHWSITKLGRTLSAFPVAPRFAKMLALGKQGGCLPYAIIMVASLSVGNPLLRDSFKYLDEEPEDDPSEDGAPKSDPSREKKRLKGLKTSGKVTQAHSKWLHPLSDLLTILKAVGAYEYHVYHAHGDAQAFCEKNFLHAKSMKEIHQLSHEITSIIASLTANASLHRTVEELSDEREELLRKRSAKAHSSLGISPPSGKQETMLRQIVTAALVDRVATLAGNQIVDSDNSSVPKKKASRYEYVTCVTGTSAFIHPSSVLFQMNPPPDYLAFTELVRASGGKVYMKGLTTIMPGWLPNLGKTLCTVDDSNVLPKPHVPSYCAEKDQVRCLARPSYSGGWKLPVQEVQLPMTVDYYRWFARALLSGEVFSGFRKITEMLVAQPSLVTQSWNVKKVNSLVEALMNKRASSKSRLAEIWESEPQFLLKEMKLWVNTADADGGLADAWPPTGEPSRRRKKKKAAQPLRFREEEKAAAASVASDPTIMEEEPSSESDSE